jgi:hypothetical protein
MGYAEKMAEGLTATGSFGAAEVRKLLNDIVEAMGKNAVIAQEADDGVVIGFAMSGAQKAMNFNVLRAAGSALTKSANIDLLSQVIIKDTDAGTTVKASIDDANTSQQTLLGFIPISPKAVLGITTYREFLDHLKAGLLRLDSGAKVELSPQG